MPFSQLKTLTFDVVGTLIDFEKGVLDSVRRLGGPGGLKGFGGTPVPARLTKPDFHFASLKELADVVDAPQVA